MGRFTAVVVTLVLLGMLAACAHRDSIDDLNRRLLEAARHGDTEGVQKLLKQGANIEARDQGGSTPLAIAVDYGHLQTADMLLQQGGSLAGAGLSGNDALIANARDGTPHRVEFLLRHASPNAKTKNDALFAAAETAPAVFAVIADPKAPPVPVQNMGPSLEEGNTAEVLLENGAELEARDVEGATPLIRAAEFGNLDVARVLLSRGADVDARDKFGRTALISAACECASIDMPATIDVLKLLVSKKANVNAVDKDGETALMAAAEAGETENVRFLVDSGAQVNATDHRGNSALMLAAGAGPNNAAHAVETTDVVKLLLSRGANPSIRNRHTRTALDLAVKSGRKDVAALLRNATKH